MLQERIGRVKAVPISCCPTCGGTLSDLTAKWEPESRTFVANGKAVKLTYREATIFEPIWRASHRGGVVGRAKLAELAFAHEIDGGPLSANALSVRLTDIKNKLAKVGYTIPPGKGNSFHAYRVVKIGEAQS